MLYFAGAEIKVNKNFCLFSIEVGVVFCLFLFSPLFYSLLPFCLEMAFIPILNQQ